MPGQIDSRLSHLSLELPIPPSPVASYVPYVVTGNLIFISGQICFINDDRSLEGRIGDNLTLQQGQKAAQYSILNTLGHLKNACHNDLDRVKKCVSLRIYVASTSDFTDQALVANGASELVEQVFGNAGKHARAAVGVTVLPLNCCVEIESVWEIAE